MANKLNERTIKEIQKLEIHGVIPSRIASQLGIHRETVSKYLKHPSKKRTKKAAPVESYKCNKCKTITKKTDYQEDNMYYALRTVGLCEECAKLPDPRPNPKIQPSMLTLPITITPINAVDTWNSFVLLTKSADVKIAWTR